MSADLGEISSKVSEKGIAHIGEGLWAAHMKTVDGFWFVLADFFGRIEAKGLKIYQDGMLANGDIGRRIVDDAVRKGSRNFEIIADLMKRGALLVKTEDIGLLKRERDLLHSLGRARTFGERLINFLKYRLARNGLLRARDRFMAERIDKTLAVGETGVLFVGAYHDVRRWLPADIEVIEIKDREKVRDYHRKFISCRRGLEPLKKYLLSPVQVRV